MNWEVIRVRMSRCTGSFGRIESVEVFGDLKGIMEANRPVRNIVISYSFKGFEVFQKYP